MGQVWAYWSTVTFAIAPATLNQGGVFSAMPIQKISIDALQKIRQYIVNALTLPEAESQPRSLLLLDDDPPEPTSLSDLGNLFSFGSPPELETHIPNIKGKWFVSTINPGVALMKLPGLKLKPETRLIAYLYRTSDDGRGVAVALPEALSTTAQLEKALNGHTDEQTPPKPEGALVDVMEAMQGDRSPISFMVASVLRRELQEMGAQGKARNWTHHRLIDSLPNQVKWQWKNNPPADLSPKVLVYPDNRAAIEFFSCRVTAPVAIYHHVDQYPAGHYKPVSTDRAIAIPQKA
jgi:hypothetical protein